jgi:hypothetical protein
MDSVDVLHCRTVWEEQLVVVVLRERPGRERLETRSKKPSEGEQADVDPHKRFFVPEFLLFLLHLCRVDPHPVYHLCMLVQDWLSMSE